MKLQSNLFDKLVGYAGRNLTGGERKGRIDLEIGSVVVVEGKEFTLVAVQSTLGKEGYVLNLQMNEVVNGKVIR